MNKIKLTVYDAITAINCLFAFLIFFYEYTGISSSGEKDIEFWFVQFMFFLIFIIPVFVPQVLNLISQHFQWKRILNVLLCVITEVIFICYYVILFMGFCLPIEEFY